MQIALGPMGQFAPLALTIAPNVERLTKLGQDPGTMMIYHRFLCASGHFNLLKLIFNRKYLRYPGFSQTTLCTALDDINSCMNFSPNDGSAAFAQWIARLRGCGPAPELHQRGD
jgi:hypothetical protein